MEKIRTAILGYGRSGSNLHAGAIEKNPHAFEMTAACDVDPERQQQARERFSCHVYDDYHEMLAKERLDLVSIVTRSDQHCQMTCDCLAAGVNVLVTKPWAIDESEAQRMMAAQKVSGKQLFPWLPARWGADLLRLRELLSENTIGNVFLVRRSVTCFRTRSDWQTERRYGGGYLLNWGPHIIDAPIQLLGSPVKTVYASMRQVINPNDGEDLFLAVMTLESGALIQAEFTITIEGMPSWFIQGDRGTIKIHGNKLKLYCGTPAHPDDPTAYKDIDGKQEHIREETLNGALYGDEVAIYAEVAEALRGSTPFAVTPSHALALTRILDAIRASDNGNCLVQL